MTLTACGSDTKPPAASTSSTSSVSDVFTPPSLVETSTEASPGPMGEPANVGTPEWTLSGTTGSIAVTGSTDTAAPLVTVKAPFSVTETQVHTLKAGDGPVVANTARVSVCYMGVNGRDG